MTTPLTLTVIDIRELDLLAPDAIPPIPRSMEARLLNKKDLEPAIILFHPKAELYVYVRLLDRDNIQTYVDQLNIAVLKQAMGETPEEEGYRIK
jgi:hypothetical protein